MLRRRFQLRYELERLVDAGIAFAALTLAILVRRELILLRPDVFNVFDFWPQAGWLYILLVALWVMLLEAHDYYSLKVVHSPQKTLATLVRVNAIGVVLAFFLFYILTVKHVPRALIMLFAGFDLCLMITKEYVLNALELRWVSRPNLLLVGSVEACDELLLRISAMHRFRPTILGILTPASSGVPAETVETRLGPIAVLGAADRLSEVLHENAVDNVVIAPGQERFGEIQRIVNLCETEGVETWLLSSFVSTRIAKTQVDEFQNLPMLVFSTTPGVSWALFYKRVLDVLLSAVLLILTAPILVAAIIAIKVTSPGPALFRQKRCSLHGRTFWMYKLRTMVNEAEQLRSDLGAHNEVDGPVFKMKSDPRVTPIGRFMRRHSIDELPQLYNVLRGEMSLVGPRPPIPDEVARYEDWQRRRLSMRPGLTCIWQTAGRNALSFDDWMRLDLEYIDTWSLGLDFKILAKTPKAIILGTGF